MIRNKLVQSVAIVVLFWWCVLTAYSLFVGTWFSFTELTWYLSESVLWIAGGLVSGVLVALLGYGIVHVTTRRSLKGRSVRGLSSTLGAPPLPRYDVPMASSLPKVIESPAVVRWLDMLEKQHPAHHALARDVLLILRSDPKMPASHIRGGHGGKTLWEHSLLVCEQALAKAPAWEYRGIYTPSGTLVTALRNPAYRFDPTDPLIGIVALAHDIGKLKTFLRDPRTGEVLKETHKHAPVSAIMLTKLDCFWLLPREDQEVILGAVTYYHEPQALPLDEGNRAYDDRTHAVMELLIEADQAAGRIECGQEAGSPSNASLLDVAFSALVWDAFSALVSETGRVNGTNKAILVGQKKGDIAVFKEQELLRALQVKLAVRDEERIKRHLLYAFDENEVGFGHHDGAMPVPGTGSLALYKVSFFSENTGQHLATWPRCFIVRPRHVLPVLSSMMDHPSRFEVEGEVAVTSSSSSAAPIAVSPSTASVIAGSVAPRVESRDSESETPQPEVAPEPTVPIEHDVLNDDLLVQETQALEIEAEEKAALLVETAEAQEAANKDAQLRKLKGKDRQKLAQLEADALLSAMDALVTGTAENAAGDRDEESVLRDKLLQVAKDQGLKVITHKNGRVWFAACDLVPHLPEDWGKYVSDENSLLKPTIKDGQMLFIGILE